RSPDPVEAGDAITTRNQPVERIERSVQHELGRGELNRLAVRGEAPVRLAEQQAELGDVEVRPREVPTGVRLPPAPVARRDDGRAHGLDRREVAGRLDLV